MGVDQLQLDVGPAVAGALRDLGVRVAERLQEQALGLARLQVGERLGRLADALPLARLLVERRRCLGGFTGRLGRRERPLALSADGERLVLDDRVEPRPQLRSVRGRSAPKQDLLSALVSNPSSRQTP
jgi:hypothetical protein